MVLREIGKDGRIEIDRASAMLDKRMARYLHGDGFVSRLNHLGEKFLEIQGFRGGPRSIYLTFPNAIFDGPDETATTLIGVKKVLYEESCRRLAIRAGYPHDLEFIGGVAVERRCDVSHRGPRIGHTNRRGRAGR